VAGIAGVIAAAIAAVATRPPSRRSSLRPSSRRSSPAVRSSATTARAGSATTARPVASPTASPAEATARIARTGKAAATAGRDVRPGQPNQGQGYQGQGYQGRDRYQGQAAYGRGPDGRGGYQDRGQFRGQDRGQDWGQYRGGYDQRQGYGRGGSWNRGWRNDNRYAWSNYRASNRGAYRLPRYYAPGGWSGGYRRFGVGFTLSSTLFNPTYWIQDPYTYRLPDAYGPYRWVRYYNDALLVDLDSGRVVDTVYDIFW